VATGEAPDLLYFRHMAESQQRGTFFTGCQIIDPCVVSVHCCLTRWVLLVTV